VKSNCILSSSLPKQKFQSSFKSAMNSRAALLVCAAFICTSTLAMAQAGSLDKTFGTAGIFTDSAGLFNNQGTTGAVLALQRDGKILAAGQIGFNAAVVRLNPNGTLDSGFGTDGTVVISNIGQSQVIGIAVQPDGKILTGISNVTNDDIPKFILARLNSNGAVDTTFGTAGIVETIVPPFGAFADVMALQPDGKILLAGSSAIARYETTGQLDSTFGKGGIANILAVTPTAIALQSDGKILIADGGASTAIFPEPGPGFSSPAGAISRYNPNGALDNTFGIFGQAASVAAISAIVVETQNGSVSNLLVAGTINTNKNSTGFGLVRFNSNGSIDTTFATNGGTITTFTGSASPFALSVQANGDIVAAGAVGTGATSGTSAFALARYNDLGGLDTSFGSGGKVTTAFGSNLAAIYALAIQSDGKIVVVGSSQHSTEGNQLGGLVVARYLSE
jgi:uncharacterized delta-60 repeat protein